MDSAVKMKLPKKFSVATALFISLLLVVVIVVISYKGRQAGNNSLIDSFKLDPQQDLAKGRVTANISTRGAELQNVLWSVDLTNYFSGRTRFDSCKNFMMSGDYISCAFVTATSPYPWSGGYFGNNERYCDYLLFISPLDGSVQAVCPVGFLAHMYYEADRLVLISSSEKRTKRDYFNLSLIQQHYYNPSSNELVPFDQHTLNKRYDIADAALVPHLCIAERIYSALPADGNSWNVECRKNGSIVWQHKLNLSFWNQVSLISDDKHIYVVVTCRDDSDESMQKTCLEISAFDLLDGVLRWRSECHANNSCIEDICHFTQHGYIDGLVLLDNRLILLDRYGELYAFDTLCGRKLWQTYIGTQTLEKSHIISHGNFIYAAGGGKIYKIASTNGAVLRSFTPPYGKKNRKGKARINLIGVNDYGLYATDGFGLFYAID